jgi:hypothetical protein
MKSHLTGVNSRVESCRMETTTPTAIVAGRDPVSTSIESLLNDLQAQGQGILTRAELGDCVRVSFGDIHAQAMNYDIALVRLASAMIDDTRYNRVLMDTLRDQIHSHAA